VKRRLHVLAILSRVARLDEMVAQLLAFDFGLASGRRRGTESGAGAWRCTKLRQQSSMPP